MTNDSTFLSPTQAARVLGIGTDRVVQLANTGKLAAIKTPLGRLFESSDVERLALERTKSIARPRPKTRQPA